MRILIPFLTTIALISCAARVEAHHSFAAEFSYELLGSRQGEIVELHFVNPHVHIFFTVKTDSGEEEIWDAQSSAPRNLLTRGWNPDTIKVGDQITIEGNLGLQNSHKLWIISMTLEDGTVIHASGGDN